jgi:hypothetical protein
MVRSLFFTWPYELFNEMNNIDRIENVFIMVPASNLAGQALTTFIGYLFIKFKRTKIHNSVKII